MIKFQSIKKIKSLIKQSINAYEKEIKSTHLKMRAIQDGSETKMSLALKYAKQQNILFKIIEKDMVILIQMIKCYWCLSIATKIITISNCLQHFSCDKCAYNVNSYKARCCGKCDYPIVRQLSKNIYINESQYYDEYCRCE